LNKKRDNGILINDNNKSIELCCKKMAEIRPLVEEMTTFSFFFSVVAGAGPALLQRHIPRGFPASATRPPASAL